MSFGLTTDGFILKPLETIVDEMETDFRDDPEIGMVPRGAAKAFIGIVALGYSELWELAEVVNSGSLDRDGATGAQLDAVNGLTGTERNGEAASAVDLTLTGVPTTAVNAGNRARATTTDTIFATLDDAIIAALAAWAGTTVYAVGDRRTNGGNAYICITAGTSDGAGGPTTTAEDITDGTVHWRYMGAGTGAVDVASEAIEVGPLVAESGDIVNIETPVGGWTGVINLLDADLGRIAETDEDFRIRGELELSHGSDGTIAGIRAFLLDPETGPAGVTSVTVFYNNSDTTDVDGVPPHSVEVMVQGGDAQDILDKLFLCVGAGIKTHGTTSGTVTDDEGTGHVFKFSRPDTVDIYVAVTLTYEAGVYPEDGDDLVKAAIVVYGDGQGAGRDAVSSRISGKGVQSVDGVLDVVSCFIGTAPAPGTSATVPIGLRELALYDTSRITVVSSPGVP